MYQYTWCHGSYWEFEAITLEVAAEKILDAWQKACEFYLYDRYNGMPINDRSTLATWEIQLFPVYKLLMGYALENIIKGIIICQMSLNDPDSIKKENLEDIKFKLKGSEQPCKITVHGLANNLLNAEVVNIVVLDKEKPLLKDLDACIIWGGKYPAPKNNKSNEPFIPMGGAVVLNPKLAEPIKAIYDKWLDELHKIIK
jgi:hypothetical protein